MKKPIPLFLFAVFVTLVVIACSPSPTPTAIDTWTRPADGMVMVYVPAGEFEMGSDDDEMDYALQLCNEYYDDCDRKWFEAGQPVHTVALDGFWIDQTKVTNAQFAQCVAAGACDRPPARSGSYTRDSYYGNSAYDNYPVIYVSWPQAKVIFSCAQICTKLFRARPPNYPVLLDRSFSA